MALLHQRAGQQFHQMDRNHRHMTSAKDGDAALAGVLQQSQLLGQGVDPIKGWQIKGPGHIQRQDSNLLTVATPEIQATPN